jgi:hypothetical protein
MNKALPELMAEARAISVEAERTFGFLTAEQLNWKRGDDQWSVAQCFEHLIKINTAYVPQWRQIEQGSYARTWRDRVPVLARLFGWMILRAVQPDATRKFKAAPHVEPSKSAIAGDILARFTTHQQEVIEHMKLVGSRDSRAVVTSPVAPLAFYSVLDAFKILVAHERRHMGQAERVMHADGFPGRSST